jgi:hypothetical protein
MRLGHNGKAAATGNMERKTCGVVVVGVVCYSKDCTVQGLHIMLRCAAKRLWSSLRVMTATLETPIEPGCVSQ